MENYDLLADLNDQGPKAAKRRNVITSVSGTSESSASISAIVTLHQTRSESVSGTRIHQTSRNQLIGILTESNANRKIDSTATTATRKKTICMEPKLQRSTLSNVVQVQLQQQPRGASATSSVSTISGKSSLAGGDPAPGKQKIPRPANAFMLFANEWRKKLAVENPRESNKDISVRLGVLWKNMAKDIKEKYFSLAREVDAEHKRKYPDISEGPFTTEITEARRSKSITKSKEIAENRSKSTSIVDFDFS